jgi:hypothetical protein
MVKLALFALALLGTLAPPALAQQQRIDLYDKQSRREGYVIINERQGRVDFYDARSRRLGYGTISGPRDTRFAPPAPRQTPLRYPSR